MSDMGGRVAAEKRNEVRRIVQHLFAKNPDWVTFFREVLGVTGIVRRSFPTKDLLDEFERSETYAEILQLLTRLREKQVTSEQQQEPTRVITVRLPRSLHEALRIEAHEHRTSMNKLCISKLLQFIEHEYVPTDK
jgi:predicted HicB family RNase H-like nuclease